MVNELARGEIVWADFGPIRGSAPAKLRPALVIQSDSLNRSRIATVVVAVITSKTARAGIGGNVFVPASASGLPRDSVVIVSQLATIPRIEVGPPVGRLERSHMRRVDEGLGLVLGLGTALGR